MSDIYKHWDSDEMIAKYAKPQSFSDRFRSETHFLEKIMKSGISMLDVGCASGSLYGGLKEEYKSISYVGIDVAPNMISKAKEIFVDDNNSEFFVGNMACGVSALKGQKFDIVIATGVFQHEPQTEDLLSNMVEATKDGGYILFDVKLLHSHATLRDIEISYLDRENKLCYVVFNLNDLLKMILSIEGVSKNVEIYGYDSGKHPKVHLPRSVKEGVHSAHVLLRKGKKNSNELLKLELNLPSDFILESFKKFDYASV